MWADIQHSRYVEPVVGQDGKKTARSGVSVWPYTQGSRYDTSVPRNRQRGHWLRADQRDTLSRRHGRQRTSETHGLAGAQCTYHKLQDGRRHPTRRLSSFETLEPQWQARHTERIGGKGPYT